MLMIYIKSHLCFGKFMYSPIYILQLDLSYVKLVYINLNEGKIAIRKFKVTKEMLYIH